MQEDLPLGNGAVLWSLQGNEPSGVRLPRVRFYKLAFAARGSGGVSQFAAGGAMARGDEVVTHDAVLLPVLKGPGVGPPNVGVIHVPLSHNDELRPRAAMVENE